jgi:excisionase family DNA binding protein
VVPEEIRTVVRDGQRVEIGAVRYRIVLDGASGRAVLEPVPEEPRAPSAGDRDAGAEASTWPEWMTSKQASAYSQCNIRTIQDACNRNELKHTRLRGKVGNPIRVRREWLDQWLEQHARGGAR